MSFERNAIDVLPWEEIPTQCEICQAMGVVKYRAPPVDTTRGITFHQEWQMGTMVKCEECREWVCATCCARLRYSSFCAVCIKSCMPDLEASLNGKGIANFFERIKKMERWSRDRVCACVCFICKVCHEVAINKKSKKFASESEANFAQR